MLFRSVFTMLLPVFIVPGVAYNEQSNTAANIADNFDVVIEKNGNTRTAIVIDLNKATVDVVSVNDVTGVITINGEIVCPITNSSFGHFSITHSTSSEDNWTAPSTSITSLALTAYSTGAIVGWLALTYGVPGPVAAYIAGLVIGAGGFLYVKAVTQFNYVDYGTKVGYRLTESLHLKSDASDEALYTRTMTGSR